MKSVPIPGDILRTTVFLGLSFDELLVLGSFPLVVVLPSLFIKQIPVIISLGIVIVMFIIVGVVIVETPDGQTPVEWAPAAIQRRFAPERYVLKPKQNHRARPTYLNVVHTADQLKEERTGDDIVTDASNISTEPSADSTGGDDDTTTDEDRSAQQADSTPN
ncbi:hypothetical protein [Salinibaculum rarum]|uniref:hypothetical protein n=1 Tax=Salinibaculum rarum TaxID=3058903 RepID=UPI00265DD164|nr:hypothetical protein [Salinibaculum sp. KK48]